MHFEQLSTSLSLPAPDTDTILTVPHPVEAETMVVRARVWRATHTVIVSDLGQGDPSAHPWKAGPLSLQRTLTQALNLSGAGWRWLTHRYPECVYREDGTAHEQFRCVCLGQSSQPFEQIIDLTPFMPKQREITEIRIPDRRCAWVCRNHPKLSPQQWYWVPPEYGYLFFDGADGRLLHSVPVEPDETEPWPPGVADARASLETRYDDLIQLDHHDGILLAPSTEGWINRSRANLTADDQTIRPGDVVPLALFDQWDPPLSTSPLEEWTTSFQG